MLTLAPEALINQLIASSNLEYVSHWSYDNDTRTWTFTFSRVKLKVTWSKNALQSQILDCNLTLPRKVIDPLRAQIRQVLTEHSQGVSFCHEFQVAVLILSLIEWVQDWEMTRDGEGKITQNGFSKWRADHITGWDSIINNPCGLDLTTVSDTAHHFLQRTPEELCQQIPSEWRVIHIESVLRADLTRRFLRYREKLLLGADEDRTSFLQDSLPPHSILKGRVRSRLTRSDVIEDMVRPRVTFHGTSLANVGSIVRYGFKLPGNIVDGKVVASPRTGIVYNRGIYSSQSPTYALSFASGQRQKTPLGDIPSMRIFVCATLMGRTYNGDSVHGPLIDGYDGHFDGRFEYIVHEESAMLPCYVIHLDLGSEAAKRALLDVQNEPEEFHLRSREHQQSTFPKGGYVAPGDKKREQERKKAAALKWFPYGYGTSKGTHFKIEEIGEISDDEEDYGEWQAQRHAYIRDEGDESSHVQEDIDYYEERDENGEMVKKTKGLFLDQYQTARRAPGLRNPGQKRIANL